MPERGVAQPSIQSAHYPYVPSAVQSFAQMAR